MSVMIRCPNPNCHGTLNVKEDDLGRTVRCTKCGQSFLAIMTPSGGDNETKTYTPEAPLVPRQLGRFLVKERLGAGAFATVYRAVDPELERDVALKVPHQTTREHPKRLERFVREAKAVARLRHPNIVPVFDAGKDGDTYFIASALIAGQTLARSIPKGGMKPQQAVRIVADLAEALAYAHARGIVHRDVKPGNVMIDADGKPQLMDFGLASRATDEERLTEHGTIMGTPAYMAPEQASGQQDKVLAATDQYSLGAVLYELLTGQPPFSGPPEVLIYNAVHTTPAAPQTVRKKVPAELSDCCLRALAKKPNERYASCQALADELRAWLAGPKASQRPAGLRRQPALAAAVAILCLLVASGLLWWQPWNQRVEDNKNSAPIHPGDPAAKNEKPGDDASIWVELATNRIKNGDSAAAIKVLEQVPEDKRDWTYKLLALQAAEGIDAAVQSLSLPRAWALLRDRPVVVMYANQKLTHFDISARTQVKDFELKGAARWSFAQFNGDGTRLAVDLDPEPIIAEKPIAEGPAPKRIGIWNTETGVQLQVIEVKPLAKQSWANPIEFSPDGKWLAVNSENQLTIWNTATGAMLPNLNADLPLNSHPRLAFSRDGRRLAAVVSDKNQRVLKIWKLPEGTLDSFPTKLVGFLNDLTFNGDGTQLALAGGGEGRMEERKVKHLKWIPVTKQVDGAVFENGQLKTIKKDVVDQVTAVEWAVEKVMICQHPGRIQIIDTTDNTLNTVHDGSTPIHRLNWLDKRSRLLFSNATSNEETEFMTIDVARKQTELWLTLAGRVSNPRITGDGDHLIAEDETKHQLQIWTTRPSRLVQQWTNLRRPAAALQFTSDGKRLIAELRDPVQGLEQLGSARVFAVDDGQVRVEAERVGRIESSDKTNWIAFYGNHNVPTARLFDRQSGVSFKGAPGVKHLLAVNDSATRAVGTNADHELLRVDVPIPIKSGDKPLRVPIDVKVHDFTTGNFVCTLEHFEIEEKQDHEIRFTQDGQRISLVRYGPWDGDTNIAVWDAQTGDRRFEAKARGGTPVLFCERGSYVTFFPANEKVDAADPKNAKTAALMQMWDYVANKKRFEAKYDGDPQHMSLTATPDGGKLMAYQCGFGIVGVWDVNRGIEEFREEGIGDRCGDEFPVSVLSPDGRWLALARSDGAIFTIPAGKEPIKEAPKTMPKTTRAAPALLPGNRELASMLTLTQFAPEVHPAPVVGAMPTVKSEIIFRDLRTGKTAFTLTGINGKVNYVAFSRDGQFLAAGSDGASTAGEVRVWKVATGAPAATFSAFKGPVRSVALSHDGALVAAAGVDRTLKVWRVEAPAAGLPK